MIKIIFTYESWEDYNYWLKEDKKVLHKINELIKDFSRTPFKGLGKPEPLKNKYHSYWSRRINDEHRLIYKFTNNEIWIAQCRYRY